MLSVHNLNALPVLVLVLSSYVSSSPLPRTECKYGFVKNTTDPSRTIARTGLLEISTRGLLAGGTDDANGNVELYNNTSKTPLITMTSIPKSKRLTRGVNGMCIGATERGSKGTSVAVNTGPHGTSVAVNTGPHGTSVAVNTGPHGTSVEVNTGPHGTSVGVNTGPHGTSVEVNTG